MRRSLIWIAAASLALVSTAGSAADVEETLRQMQQRMAEMEARLDATTDELEAANERVEQQQELIHNAGLAEPQGSSSGLASFLETIEIGGWVAASYFYNFNDPSGNNLGGVEPNNDGGNIQGGFFNGNAGGNVGECVGGCYPFHPDSNSFSLDQLWFEIERAVNEENRAGFRADIVLGKTAGLLSGDYGAGDGLSGNDLELYQGYVQYLAPVGPGIHFKMGKFGTPIGAEVAASPYNFNITRGNVYTVFQPITHTGLSASIETDNGASFLVGVVNETRSFPARDIDVNDQKALIWSLAWAGDTVGASFNGAYGSSDAATGVRNTSNETEVIYDVILSWDPSEKFSGYVNFDYRHTDNNDRTLGGDQDERGYGIAAAGRYAITDRLGLAFRGEWIDLKFKNQFQATPSSFADNQKLKYWGLTTTADYSLTENLVVRSELRYDNYAQSSNGAREFSRPFIDGNDPLDEKDQFVAGVEVIYNF